MKHTVILLGGPHAKGNTSVLAEAMLEGITAAGGTGEIIRLAEKKIGYCMGCRACFGREGKCVQQDDMPDILDKLVAADNVVFATPLYFMDMSAQLRTCIDRFFGYFHARKLSGDKKSALIVTSGGPSEEAAMPNIYGTFQSLAKLLGWQDCGYVWAGGIRDIEALKTSDAVKAAADLGSKLAE